MSEDQLLERDEAIFGDKAKHIQEQQERGDTVLNVDGIQERSQVILVADPTFAIQRLPFR